MASRGETLISTFNLKKDQSSVETQTPRRISMEGLQRAFSDLSFQLGKEAKEAKLTSISEVEEAKCTCCGMSEDCTQEYISRIKERFSGKWICGICSEAVKEEVQMNGGDKDEALRAHVSVCVKFKVGRTQPVLSQAMAMREIFRKRSQSTSSIEKKYSNVKKGITRSSSCIPAISKDFSQRSTMN